MTFRIVAGAIAALAFAGAAHAQDSATSSSGAGAQTGAPPAQDCTVYSSSDACAPGVIGDSQGQAYGQQSQWGAPADQSQAASASQSDERWRRPERRGWRRVLLPLDLVREGASAVKHKL